MLEEQRAINGGQRAREAYASQLEANRLKAAAERVVNPRDHMQDADLQHTVFPFDAEPPIGQAAGASGAPAIAAVSGFAHVAQKIPLLANVNSALVQVGLPIAATILIGAGIGLGIVSIVNNINVQNQVKNYATQAKDSGQVGNSAVFTPSTNPKEPVKVEIPDLSISADTIKVDVNKQGNIGSPANIAEAAWYQNSASPADATGTALIDGHVGTKTYAGAFADLYKIKSDALIKLTMGDGKIQQYKVTKVEDITAGNVVMSNYLTKTGQVDKKLVLMTCTGDYNATTYSYTDRLIVTAVSIHG